MEINDGDYLRRRTERVADELLFDLGSLICFGFLFFDERLVERLVERLG